MAAVARPIYEHLIAPEQADYLSVLAGRRWIGRVDATGAVAFAVGLVTLAEHTSRGRSFAVPLLGLGVIAHPPLAVRDDLAIRISDVPGTPGVWTAALVLATIQVAFAAVALVVLHAGVAARPGIDQSDA